MEKLTLEEVSIALKLANSDKDPAEVYRGLVELDEVHGLPTWDEFRRTIELKVKRDLGFTAVPNA